MHNQHLLDPSITVEILDIVCAVILVMDKEGHILFFNKAAESMTGFNFNDIQNKHPWDLFILPDEIERVKNVFSRLTAGHYPNKHTNYWVTKNKAIRLIDWANTAITNKNGDIEFIIATGIDITEQNIAENEIKNHISNLENTISKRTAELTKANSELAHLTRIDGLTNIFNRRYFDETLEKEIGRSKRSKKTLSLLICDIDYFKNYNDTYGHVEGDNCLIQIATTLNNFFNRASDFVARYGGEEFIVILPETATQDALNRANKLIQKITKDKAPHASSSVSEFVTLSIGLASIRPDELTTSKSLIENADKALYQAKHNGRNRVQLYSLEK